jgi:hypothetical protein
VTRSRAWTLLLSALRAIYAADRNDISSLASVLLLFGGQRRGGKEEEAAPQ